MDLEDGQTRRRPLGPRRPKTTHVDASVQTQKTPTATFVPPTPLTSPPTVSFESNPIPWKGLPLEAAQWTFSSVELQDIVSKAIRLSARDSFVRLLSTQAIDADIPRESQRLQAARLEAQAKWRFEVGRRTMLMHALNASAAFPPSEHPPDGGNPTVPLVRQLATAIAASDSLLSTILQTADQQSQIALIQHQHWASALGVALRKLNRAHERQAQQLKDAQARVHTLQDELEEAWREAEKMAVEFDDFEQGIADSESERASQVLDPGSEQNAHPLSDLGLKHDLDETGTLGDVTINTDLGVVLGVTATAVASKATLVTSTHPEPVDKSDTRSIRSVKSTRSRRSARDGHTHLARLSSARLRSRAASNASLRLPKALRSTPSTHTSPTDTPPVPTLPPTTDQGQSFLDMDNATHDHPRKSHPTRRHPEPTSALPTPPHSAGLPETRVPSLWLETDGEKSTARLTAFDRSHSLQIFSAFASSNMRRSNLVMSLTGSLDEGVASTPGSGSGSGSGSRSASPGAEHQNQVPAAEPQENGRGTGPAIEPETENGNRTGTESGAETATATAARNGNENGTVTENEVVTGTRTASPTSNHSPVSLPTHALAHFRGPSLSSSSHSMGTCDPGGASKVTPRPGSAGARLTTTKDEKETRTVPIVARPKRSLVSRASSVILRGLSRSQVTVGSGGGKRTAPGRGTLASPSRPREALRLSGSGRTLVERWKDRAREGDGLGNRVDEREGEDEGEGEVMLIGSPHADLFDAP